MATGRDEAIIAKKDLGQHWLDEKPYLKAIVDLANLAADDVVVEIGPGLGSLSQELIQQSAKVIAIELDSSLIAHLKIRFANQPIEIINEDIRKFNFNQLPINYKIVANIPYYLTSYLIRELCQISNPPLLAVLLVQSEVANRLSSRPGQMSLLSVITQSYWQVDTGILIPASAFQPQPKVDSRVVRLTKRQDDLVPKKLQKDFIRLVKVGFSQKRKTLANNLMAGFGLKKDQANDLLTRANLDTAIRAQALSIDDWLKLVILILAK